LAEPQPVGYDIKWALAPKLWGHDGSLTGGWTEITASMVPFLEGVVAAGPETEQAAEARDLIRLLHLHGKIEVALIND
jgi:hypothetical protein